MDLEQGLHKLLLISLFHLITLKLAVKATGINPFKASIVFMILPSQLNTVELVPVHGNNCQYITYIRNAHVQRAYINKRNYSLVLTCQGQRLPLEN